MAQAKPRALHARPGAARTSLLPVLRRHLPLLPSSAPQRLPLSGGDGVAQTHLVATGLVARAVVAHVRCPPRAVLFLQSVMPPPIEVFSSKAASTVVHSCTGRLRQRVAHILSLTSQCSQWA